MQRADGVVEAVGAYGDEATRRSVVAGMAKIAAAGALVLAGGQTSARAIAAQDATPEATSDESGAGGGGGGGNNGNGGGGGRRNRDTELPAVGVGAATAGERTAGLLGLGAAGALAAAFVAHRLTGARRQTDA